MMKNKKIYIAAALAAALCSGLLSGCMKEEVSGGNVSGRVPVQMKLEAQDGSGRATAFSSLKVYAFSGGKQIGYHNVTTAEQSAGRFIMDIDQMVETGMQDVTFYAVADEGAVRSKNRPLALDPVMSRSALDGMSFDMVVNDLKSPMACRTEGLQVDMSPEADRENDKPEHGGHLIVNRTIDLRLSYPLGKLELYFACGPNVAPNGLVIKEGTRVLKNGLRAENYLFPVDDQTLGAVEGFDVDKPVLLKNNGIVAKTLSNKTENADDYEPMMARNIFLFENPYGCTLSGGVYDFDRPGDPKGNVVRVEYSVNGADKEKDIYLPPIERGKTYRVLCWIDDRGTVTVTYNVLPWAAGDTYELDGGVHPTYSCVPYSGEDYNTDVWLSNETAAYPYLRPGSVTFRFKMSSNQPWTPSLQPRSGFDMAVTQVSNNQVMPSGNIPAGEYFITVWPTADSSVGDKTALGITSRSLTGEHESLLINSERKWKPADSDISIEIVRTDQPSN